MLLSILAPSLFLPGPFPQETTAPQDEGVVVLPESVVLGRRRELIGVAASSSEGRVGAEDLELRPLLRPGEVLETVPGLVVTQHSGSGKANQFFLRGFNLDHGTDFLTRIEGVPINLPSHGHGQGYTDVNFLIPELVEELDFRKGPYYARNGDFASAGSAELSLRRNLPEGFLNLKVGSFDSYRALAADSFATAGGDQVLYAMEVAGNDGPWDFPEDLDRQNGVLRWSRGEPDDGASLTFFAYDAEWRATDQIPERAVESGEIGRFGSIDPSDAGRTSRFLAVGEWAAPHGDYDDRVSAWAQYYGLQLYSNFTFFLDDPVNGDQFLQEDQRVSLGAALERSRPLTLAGREGRAAAGLELRDDEIDNGLFHTRTRSVIGTTREDEIREASAGLWTEFELPLADKVRATAGVRGDFFHFDVESDDPDNSGDDNDAIASPKLGFVFGPWAETEVYANGGLGFHSNDARGVFTTDDPGTPAPADGVPVDPLVRTKGAEVGVRTLALEGLQSTVSLWVLESDSEILFVGDAGSTEASRPSRRVGVELANFYEPVGWLAFDVDASLSRARFTDDDPAGDEIPGSIESVVTAGATVRTEDGWYGSLRFRYFGPRPLIEDGSVESSSSSLFNLGLGKRIGSAAFEVEVLNLFDAEVDDIAYFYPSRLQGEPVGPDDGGFNDIHFHPAEPFTLRLSMTLFF